MRAPILLLGIASLLTGADTPGPFGLDPATEQEAPPVAPGADQQSPFGPDAKPGAGKPAPALRPTSHRPWTDGLRAYCTEKNLSLTETGDGPVRLLNIGGAAVKGEEVLAYAKQTLAGYEMWTAQQQAFMSKTLAEDDMYHLVVFKNDGDFSGLIDWLRAKQLLKAAESGEDLVKKLGGFPALRVMFAKGEGVTRIPGHWAIYATSCLAIDAFYHARGEHRAPAWIREGMAAEMQRLQLKSIRCTTIAYEDRKDQAVENWAKEVARIISTRDQMAITASDVTRLSLNALPGAHYRQMWSLCAYVRGKCGTGKGAENPFLQLLTATAAGESSEVALKRILKLSDPTLTPAWRAWAIAQK